MQLLTLEGSMSKIYVDREHVKVMQGRARPWVVENNLHGKFRCRIVDCKGASISVFEIDQAPCLFFVTIHPVKMMDVEKLDG